MLGRTNITTIKGGTIATDIASYDWNDAATLNVNSSFKKSFYANNILIAITQNGSVIYTRDGENWEEATPEMDVKYNISDGMWDGHRFVFVGSHSTDTEGMCSALIITTEDFQNYEIMRECAVNEIAGDCGRFHSILLNEDSTYTIIYSTAVIAQQSFYIRFVQGDLLSLRYTCPIETGYLYYNKDKT